MTFEERLQLASTMSLIAMALCLLGTTLALWSLLL
jgi:hypothetical protein